MNSIIKLASLLVAAGMVAGCVEETAYTNGYYSSGSYATDISDTTVGYNRDYHRQRNRNATPVNNGYASSGSRPAGYISRKAPRQAPQPPASPVPQNGYSSSTQQQSRDNNWQQEGASSENNGYNSTGSQSSPAYFPPQAGLYNNVVSGR